jgi:hypothetical protein
MFKGCEEKAQGMGGKCSRNGRKMIKESKENDQGTEGK